MSYKVQQFLMFAGVAAVLFCAVVVIPFVYGIYLTLTSWDGIAKTKPFVGLANYAEAFKDVAYWQALGRTAIYSIFAVVLINVVAFALAYLVTSGIKGQNFFRAGFFVPNLIGGIVLGYVWKFVFNRAGNSSLTVHSWQLLRRSRISRSPRFCPQQAAQCSAWSSCPSGSSQAI